jgi:voltage-gated potassium channel
MAPTPKIGRWLHGVVTQTYFPFFLALLIVLWLLFSAGIYFSERGVAGATINSYGRALYWGIAAFSTAGIADTPLSGASQVIGGIWIVLGSAIFFGTIIATVTGYFMHPMQRPAKQIVDTIEYNLEHLEDLSVDELTLLKETADALILHMERVREQQASGED